MTLLRKLFHRPPPVPVLLNLPDLGPRPEWKDIAVQWDNPADPRTQFLLHLLALHLGSARADHEDDATTPDSYRAHAAGRACAVNAVLADLRLLMTQQADKFPEHVKRYFGWTAEGEKK